MGYGRHDDLTALAERPAGPEGEREHERAVTQQLELSAIEQARDPHTDSISLDELDLQR